MKKTDLQLFIGEKITNSKFSNEFKLQMLNYIQHEADIHQLMALLLDGRIVKIEDDISKQIIEDRFNTVSEVTNVGLAAMAAVTAYIIKSKREYKFCIEHCKKKEGSVQQNCMYDCRHTFKEKKKQAKLKAKEAKRKAKEAKKNKTEE